jgi:hypothetical protein
MGSTSNSMDTLPHDQVSEHQRDDKRRLSRQDLPSKSCSRVSTKEEPSPPPIQTARIDNTLRRFRHARRSFWIVIQDIEATKKFHKHENYKHRDAKASINALDRLIHQYDLQHKNRTGAICQPSGENLRKILQSIWGPRKSEDARESTTIWVASKKDWNSSYLRTIEEACTELTLEESLPVYDPARAEPFSTDASGHGKEKGSRFGRAGAIEDKRSHAVAGAKGEGDPETEIEEPAIDSIVVGPMVIEIEPPEPQRSCRKSPLKVCLKTHLLTIEANTT